MLKLFGFGLGCIFVINSAIVQGNTECSEFTQLIDSLCASKCRKHYCERGPTGPQGPAGPKGERGNFVIGPTGPQGSTGALTTNSACFYRAGSTQQSVSIDPASFILFDTPRYSSAEIVPSNSLGTAVAAYDTFTVQANGLYQITWSFNSLPNVANDSEGTLLIANLCKNGTPIPPNPSVQQSCIVRVNGAPFAINSFLSGSLSIFLANQDYIQLQVSGLGNPNIEPFANICQATITITQIGLSL